MCTEMSLRKVLGVESLLEIHRRSLTGKKLADYDSVLHISHLYRVILDGSKCSGLKSKFFSSSSNTARPPAWMQKCSKASLKSGMYGFTCILNSFRHTSVPKKSSCSESGSTSGPRVVMLAFNASPAIAMRSFDSETPTFLLSSSSWNTHLQICHGHQSKDSLANLPEPRS